MGVLPVNVVLSSDPAIAHHFNPQQFSTVHQKLRGTIGDFLLKVGEKGDFRAHLFSDHGTDKNSGGHQKIWLESQNITSIVFAVRPDGNQIFLVRLKVPEGDDSSQRKFRSTVAHALEPKEPAVSPRAAPPLPTPAPVPPPAIPSSGKRAYHRRTPEEKKGQGKVFSLKGWLTDTANIVHVLLTLRSFLEKKDQRRAPGKVLVGVLRSSGVLPEARSPKSFNLIGMLLEDMGYIEKVKVGVEKPFRLTPHAEDFLRKHLEKGNPSAFHKPPSPSEAILGRMHDPKAAEMFELISVQMAELTRTFERLAKHLGGRAG